MATKAFLCPGCNVRYRSKSYDPEREYTCPKCGGALKEYDPSRETVADGTLDSGGQLRKKTAKDPLVGKKLADYVITRKLGEGGMGTVYQAKHAELERIVALKLLSPELVAKHGDAVERFKREARAAAVLEHPNVAMVYAVGAKAGHHFIEMQYVDGESLQDKLRNETQLSIEEATRITRDAAKALEAAHARSIVHRDIKPGNIMLSDDGVVKVMDFGLAKDVTAPTQLTISGQIMGTPYYMSPEQCEAQPLDGRADLYSLGATYFHLLTGKVPYTGDSLLAIMRQHTDAPIPKVRDELPDAPKRVQRVIEKAMAKKPEDRYATAADMIADLELALVDAQQLGAAATVRMAAKETPSTAGWLSKWPVWVAAGVAVLVVAVLLWPRSPDEGRTKVAAVKEATETVAEPEPASPARPAPRPAPTRSSDPAGFALWKRVGPTVRVPGPDGKVQQLPAGVVGGNALEYSPDGKRLAVAHSFGVDLYDTRDWTIVRRFDGHEQAVASMAFTRDGTKLAAGSRDGPVRIWDVTTGRELHVLEGHKHLSATVAFSPDGRRLASGSPARVVMLWNVESGELLRTLKGRGQWLRSVAFSGDGREAAAVTSDGTITVWDAETGGELRTAKGRPTPRVVRLSPDGRRVAAGINDGTVYLWDVDTGAEAGRYQGHPGILFALGFSHDSQRLASGCLDCQVRLWNTQTGQKTESFRGHRSPVLSVAVSPDDRYLASSASDGSICIWCTRTGKLIRGIKAYGRSVLSMAVSPDRALVASGCDDGTVRLWRMDSGAEARTLKQHTRAVHALALSPNGRYLASGSGRGANEIVVCDPHTGKELRRLTKHTSTVNWLTFSPDSTCMASASADKTVGIWRPKSGWRLQSLRGHTATVWSVAFDRTRPRVASVAADKTLRLWNPKCGSQLNVLRGPTSKLCTVAFSPNGRRLISGTDDGTIWIWDSESGRHLKTLEGHTGSVWSVATSPGCKLIASGGADCTVRVWDPDRGKQVGRLTAHRGDVRAVAFSSGGKLLASASNDGTVCLWQRGRLAGLSHRTPSRSAEQPPR